ncbi:hypothetical protein KBI23_04495 [bacterium]|nr:hypothetical protein [bacterium]MBP9807364.1 hypothetical protein [bacterium]
MDNADRKPSEWTQSELKVSDPELVAKSDILPSALIASGDIDEVALPLRVDETNSAALLSKPEPQQKSHLSALTTYMLENESQFYWLFASALLTWLGVWFHDTHGMLTWTSGPICFLTFAIGLLSPIACIPILFCKPNRYERPLLTIVSFVAMLFWNQVPTVSFFALMLFRFRKASRTLGIAVLTGLQIAVFFLLPFFFGPSEELDHLRTAGYNLSICKVTLPVDATHVAVLVNRFSHYHRTVVDLTVKNLPIQVETIPAEK